MAWWKSGTRVSSQSSLPRKVGEFAAAASAGAVASWAALKVRAKSAGVDAQVDLEGGVGGLGDDAGQLDVEVSGPSMTTRRSGFIGSRAADSAR